MQSTLIELHFLPSIEYFCALVPFEKISLERHEHFTKQTYRNRCHILTSNGPGKLTIPLTSKHGKVMITNIRIDYTERWQDNFWRTLVSAYAKAPYFEHYADELRKEIFYGHPFLYDLNFRLLSLCLSWLNWNKTILETDRYEKIPDSATTDLRSVISAKKDFRERNIYRPQPYQQVFGAAFSPNLSLLDLVFCAGPDCTTLVNHSGHGI